MREPMSPELQIELKLLDIVKIIRQHREDLIYSRFKIKSIDGIDLDFSILNVETQSPYTKLLDFNKESEEVSAIID